MMALRLKAYDTCHLQKPFFITRFQVDSIKRTLLFNNDKERIIRACVDEHGCANLIQNE